MKKVMMVLLAVALIMSMAIPAFAATASPTASVASPTGGAITAPACGCGKDACTCQAIAWAQRSSLPAEKKAVFEEAKDSMKDAVPEGFAARNVVYILKGENCTSCTMTMTVKSAKEVAVKQYVNGAWADKSVSLADSTATINDVVEGPLAIFTK